MKANRFINYYFNFQQHSSVKFLYAYFDIGIHVIVLTI